MGILTKEVEVRPTGKSIQYYKDKGYDAAHLKPIVVKVEDLPEHSDRVVEILCDYCKENIISMKYSTYKKGAKNIEKHACKDCRYEKIKEVTQKIYGVKSVLSLSEVREKGAQTMLEKYDVDCYSKTDESKEKCRETNLIKYGYDNPSKNPLIKEKRKNTNLQKFGYEYNLQSPEIRKQIEETCLLKYGYQNISQVPEIQEKKKNTFLLHYGTENPFQLPEIQEKAKQTFLNNYGVDNPNKSPDVRAKTARTLYKNGTTPTSKQQLFLFNFYRLTNKNICINFPIAYYNVDICFSDEKLVIEYDGGFHNGQVKTSKMTQEEFNQKEIVRNNIIKREGYKQMRIISSKDLLPSDTTLLQMLSDARNYFSEYPNRSWIEFNLDTSIVRNAENKQGVYYDFGALRRIKDEDLTNQNDLTTKKGA